MLRKVVGGPLPADSPVLSRKSSPPSPPHHCLPPERESKWSASLNFVSGVLLVRHNGRPVPVVPGPPPPNLHNQPSNSPNPSPPRLQKNTRNADVFSYGLPWSFFCCQQGCFWALRGSTVLVQRRVRAAA